VKIERILSKKNKTKLNNTDLKKKSKRILLEKKRKETKHRKMTCSYFSKIGIGIFFF